MREATYCNKLKCKTRFVLKYTDSARGIGTMITDQILMQLNMNTLKFLLTRALASLDVQTFPIKNTE